MVDNGFIGTELLRSMYHVYGFALSKAPDLFQKVIESRKNKISPTVSKYLSVMLILGLLVLLVYVFQLIERKKRRTLMALSLTRKKKKHSF